MSVINISGINSNEITITGLDIAIVVPYKTIDDVKIIIDIILNIIGLNETRLVSFSKETGTVIGLKFVDNISKRINVIRRILFNEPSLSIEEINNENCIIFKISGKKLAN